MVNTFLCKENDLHGNDLLLLSVYMTGEKKPHADDASLKAREDLDATSLIS